MFTKAAAEATWRLPNGTSAEQWGDRQTDMLLVWTEDKTSTLDEPRLRSRWPECRRVQRLGEKLFILSGIEFSAANSEEEPFPPQGCPHQHIEELLAAARRQGNLAAEATALTDWGLVLIREGKIQQAREKLDETLKLVRRLGDRSRESDVLNYLGLAAVNAGQSQLALEILDKPRPASF
jgi:hypothetical protein